MTDKLDFNLFEQVQDKLKKTDNKLAEKLAKTVQEAYETSGPSGIEKLFVEIREKYVGGEE